MYSETTFKKQWLRQTNPNDSLNHFPVLQTRQPRPGSIIRLAPRSWLVWVSLVWIQSLVPGVMGSTTLPCCPHRLRTRPFMDERCSDQICQLWSPELSHPGQVLWMGGCEGCFLELLFDQFKASRSGGQKPLFAYDWKSDIRWAFTIKLFMLMVFLDTTVQKRLQTKWPRALFFVTNFLIYW